MKAIILSTVLGLTLVATSATAAVNTEETSVWRKIKFNKTEVSAKIETAKNQEWQIIKVGKDASKNQSTQVWRKIKF
ncbi:MAG: hypothetical protein HRU22_11440 [Gammaproteobacteria bacterium]|nr:hypothetical protein [Gammaproteobacteria bacterium]